MAVELRSNQEISVAVLSGILDGTEGQRLVSEVMGRVQKGGKLVVDGSGLTHLTEEGVAHLIAVQDWASTMERRRLRIVGFRPAVWQEIVKQHGEWLFDAQDTLAAALESLGVVPAPPAPPEAIGEQGPQAPRPLAEAPLLRPAVLSSPSRNNTDVPLPFPSESSSAVPPLPLPMASRPTPSTVNPVRPNLSRPQRHAGDHPWLVPLLAGAAILALTGLGLCWWRLSSRPPSVSVSVTAVSAEEDGKEVDDVTVHVQRGKLMETSWAGLPRGLFFEPASDAQSNKTYLLRGKAENGARSASVQLEAISEKGTHSPPVAFRVNVTEKPMVWQLNTLKSLSLKVGSPIVGESKFVTGAVEASAVMGLPPGLRTELVPGTSKDWQLAGMPTAAGSYHVNLRAEPSTGAPVENSCQLEVAADNAELAPPPRMAASPTTPPLAADTTPVQPNPSAPAPPTPTSETVDDGMRKFLLERIENLPSRYTDEDRENLRLVVSGLKQARLIQRVTFERVGQTEISVDQSAKLQTTLRSPETEALLKNPDCQIAIVGYASKSGSLAANVRISKARARQVDALCRSVLGRNADLCGDYGPTDVVDQQTEQANRAVEVYAGLLDLPIYLRSKAVSFRDDFNRRHGAH